MKKINLFCVVVFTALFSFSQGIEFNQIQNWTGSGNSVAVLIFDFNDFESVDCWAFGYRFDGVKTAEDMMNDISANNPNLTINISGGFLNDIIYNAQQGIAASPNYWMTFVYDSISWQMNWDGIGEVLTDSIYFGCTYSEVDSLWNPIYLPENPTPAPSVASINNNMFLKTQVFPNPAKEFVSIALDQGIYMIDIYDLTGRIVMTGSYNNQNEVLLDIYPLQSGLYVGKAFTQLSEVTFSLIKQ